ncbi:MAG: hypothetical protein ACJAV0_000630, partial [Shewanella sp.]
MLGYLLNNLMFQLIIKLTITRNGLNDATQP